MNRKFIGFLAVLIATLFMLTPISAMSSITMKSNATNEDSLIVIEEPATTTIAQSDFVVNLDGNEKVVWIADSVTRDDDVAYITASSMSDIISLGLKWCRYRNYVFAKNWWGRPLFYLKAQAWFKTDGNEWSVDSIECSTAGSLCFRYSMIGLDQLSYPKYPHTTKAAELDAVGYFIDRYVHREPVIHSHSYICFLYGMPYGNNDEEIDWGD